MILIVDDDPTSRRLLEMVLRRENHETLAAPDANEALKILLHEGDNVNLLVCDVSMPGMSGLELVERIRQIPTLRRLPVIMCTNRTDRAAMVEAGRSNVRAYICKPIVPDKMRETVREILESTPPIDPSQDTMNDLGLDLDEYHSLATTTLEHFTSLLNDLSLDNQRQDAKAGMEVALRARESATLFGAVRLLEPLQALENAPGERPQLHLLGLVAEELARVVDALTMASDATPALA